MIIRHIYLFLFLIKIEKLTHLELLFQNYLNTIVKFTNKTQEH